MNDDRKVLTTCQELRLSNSTVEHVDVNSSRYLCQLGEALLASSGVKVLVIHVPVFLGQHERGDEISTRTSNIYDSILQFVKCSPSLSQVELKSTNGGHHLLEESYSVVAQLFQAISVNSCIQTLEIEHCYVAIDSLTDLFRSNQCRISSLKIHQCVFAESSVRSENQITHPNETIIRMPHILESTPRQTTQELAESFCHCQTMTKLDCSSLGRDLLVPLLHRLRSSMTIKEIHLSQELPSEQEMILKALGKLLETTSSLNVLELTGFKFVSQFERNITVASSVQLLEPLVAGLQKNQSVTKLGFHACCFDESSITRLESVFVNHIHGLSMIQSLTLKLVTKLHMKVWWNVLANIFRQSSKINTATTQGLNDLQIQTYAAWEKDSEDAFVTFCKALQSNKSLRRLYIGTIKNEWQCSHLLQVVPSMQALKELNLDLMDLVYELDTRSKQHLKETMLSSIRRSSSLQSVNFYLFPTPVFNKTFQKQLQFFTTRNVQIPQLLLHQRFLSDDEHHECGQNGKDESTVDHEQLWPKAFEVVLECENGISTIFQTLVNSGKNQHATLLKMDTD